MRQLGLSDAYLDTCVLAAAIESGIPHHAACASFCQRLREAKNRVVFSQIVHLEFAQVWFRLPATSYLDAEIRRRFRLGAWDRREEVREQWMDEGITRLDGFLDRFAGVVEVPLTQAILLAGYGLMARHRLRSHDAIHAATALLAGVADFASVDDDFRRVPNLRLHLLRDSAP